METDPSSPHYGHLYVADTINQRIQELTADGRFVSMFGWDVNATKDGEAGTTQAQKNVCTAREVAAGARCRAGVAGTSAGQFAFPYSIAIDPASGDLYIQELNTGDFRVDRYTAGGRFVWMAGKEVNQTRDFAAGVPPSEKNLCTAASRDVCTAGVPAATGSTEPAAFKFIQSHGDLLAVGPEGFLYVGDQMRVQVFRPDGTWAREIPLTAISWAPDSWVTALAVDRNARVYVVYRRDTNVVRIFDRTGKQIEEFPVAISDPGAEIEIGTLTLDASDHSRS